MVPVGTKVGFILRVGGSEFWLSNSGHYRETFTYKLLAVAKVCSKCHVGKMLAI